MSSKNNLDKFYKLAAKAFICNKPYKIILMPRKYGLTYAITKEAKKKRAKIIRKGGK